MYIYGKNTHPKTNYKKVKGVSHMKSVILNGLYMEEPEHAHQYIKEKLNLPDRYQNNLNTLYDCLNEMQNTHIEVFHSTSKNEYFQEIIQVFKEAGQENDDIIITLQ